MNASTSAANAATQFVTVNGDQIAYRKTGSGAAIVLANRMRGTLDTWDPLFIDSLARHHTVITFDYPGIGYSGGTLPTEMSALAAMVREFAGSIGLDRFVMGGWSWGGLVAQTVIIESPELVTHGLLIGTNPPGQNEHPIRQAFLDRALKPVNDLEDEEVLFFEPESERSRQAAKASRARIHGRQDVDAKIPSTMEAIMQYIVAARLFHEDPANRRAKLQESQTPMLVLGGTNDPSTQTQNWYPLIGKIPRAQLIVLPESGHAPQHQYPELSAQYIAAFLGRPAT